MRHFRCWFIDGLAMRACKIIFSEFEDIMIPRVVRKISTMAREFHPQTFLHRDCKRDGFSVLHQRSLNARNLDVKRKSESGQPKRHRSCEVGGNERNTKENFEPSQKEELIITNNRKNEKIAGDRKNFENSRPWPKSLMEEVEKMLKIEEFHVISFKDITNVEWCPAFVKPDIHGPVRGGKELSHHRCRLCNRLCLHLLGIPGTKRYCLECSGKWEKKYIPVWYYHEGCKYCEKK